LMPFSSIISILTSWSILWLRTRISIKSCRTRMR
jgi:hypothetical protein